MPTRPIISDQPQLSLVSKLIISLILLIGVACANSQAGFNSTPKIARLPTLTPTVSLVEISGNSVAVTSESPPASIESNGLKTVNNNDWGFTGLRTVPPDGGGLQLLGEVLNNTNQPQIIKAISGTFYDDQGLIIAGPDSTNGEWPIELIQPGERIPFKLTVAGIQTGANFELSVAAEPGTETTRQDFQFIGLEPSIQADQYCITGVLQNPGDELQTYLIIGLVLYDDQDNVVNFSSYNELYFAGVTGEQMLDFEICVPPPNQNVARHQVRAWGQ